MSRPLVPIMMVDMTAIVMQVRKNQLTVTTSVKILTSALVPMFLSMTALPRLCAVTPMVHSLANVPQDFLVTVSTVLILTNALTARLQLTS